MKKQPVVFSKLLCSECQTSMTIPRKLGKQRKQGHVKHMYCMECKKETAFIEGVVKDKKVSFWETWQRIQLEKRTDNQKHSN